MTRAAARSNPLPSARVDPVPRIAAESVPWLSVAEMREVDRLMVEEVGISLVQMMENAGRNLALLARLLLGGDAAGQRILVLAGPGGNGGGGLAAARHLKVAGADVEVRLSAPPERLAPVTSQQHAIVERIGVAARVGSSDLGDHDLVIDALLGYGQEGDPRGETAALIERSAGCPILALDVPSGLELATGTVRSPAVRAEATLTLALPKRGLRAETVGALYLGDISVPMAVYARVGREHRSPFSRGPLVRIDEANRG